jgi:LytTr DNA-binding domain
MKKNFLSPSPALARAGRLSEGRLLLHVLFWTAVICFNVTVYHHDDESYWQTLVTSLGFLPGHLIFAYGLIYYLLPRFVFRRRIWNSFIWLLMILFLALLYGKIADVYILHYSGRTSLLEQPLPALPRTLLALFATAGPALSLKLTRAWYEEKVKQRRLEEAKLAAEEDLRRVGWEIERLKQAVLGKAEIREPATEADSPAERPDGPMEGYLYLRAGRKMVKVLLHEILYVESQRDYIRIFRVGLPPLSVKKPLSALAAMLPRDRFIRIHRSFIVSKEKLTAFTQSEVEIGEMRLPVGKGFRRKELPAVMK